MEVITEEIFRTIRKIVRHSELHSHQFRRQSGMTRSQFLLMSEIDKHPDKSIGEMAENLSLSQATATTVLDSLENEGFAYRHRSELDKRRVHMRLTDKGYIALKNAPNPIHSYFLKNLERLKPYERSALLSSLQLVGDMLESSQKNTQNSDSCVTEFLKR